MKPGLFEFSGGGGGGGGAVDSVFGRTGVVVAVAGDYTASEVDNVPAGNIAATDVQGAIDELDTEKVAKAGDTMTGVLTINRNTAAAPAPFGDPGLHYAAADGTIARYLADSFGAQSNYSMRRANGTNAAPSSILTGDGLGNLNAAGYGATGYGNSVAAVAFFAAEDWTDTAQGTRIAFRTTQNGAAGVSTRFAVENDGSFVYNGGSLTGVHTINAVDYFDNGVNINAIYAGLAAANVFTQPQTINSASGKGLEVTMAAGAGPVIQATSAVASQAFFSARSQDTPAVNATLGGVQGRGYTADGVTEQIYVNLGFRSREITDGAWTGQFQVATRTAGVAGNLMFVDGIDGLQWGAVGQIVVDTNRILRPRSYTVGTLPSVTTTGIIHCSDLGGGAGLLSSDGTGWVREDNSGTITIATDAGHTFTWDRLVDAPVTRGNATLTADRTATLSTTGCRNGDRAMFVRLGGGAFNWNIAGGTTFALTDADQFCTFEFDGTTWNIIDAGRISVASGGGGSISDAAYGPSWDGDTTDGASKNAIYDAIQQMAVPSAVSGNYILLSSAYAGGVGSTHASGVSYWVPFYNDEPRTIDELGARVQVASAGGLFQVAIYASGANGLPTGSELAKTASLSTTTSGNILGTITPVTIPRGWLWFASQIDNTTATFVAGTGSSVQSPLLRSIGHATLATVINGAANFLSNLSTPLAFGTWGDVTGATWTGVNATMRAPIGIARID